MLSPECWRYYQRMRAIAGTVVGERSSSKPTFRPARQSLFSLQAAGGFQLTAEEEDELFASLEDIQSGNYIDADELLQELRTLYGR